MKKKIFVTGSDGFIGLRLVSCLYEKGFDVLTFGRAQGDIVESNIAICEISHIFHLAGKIYIPESWKNPSVFYRDNIIGTQRVLELCRQNQCSMTFVSSYVYGEPRFLPISENHPVNPNNPYSHSKYMAEEICAFYAEQFDCRLTIIRPFNIYGPNMDERLLFSKIIRQMLDPEIDCIEISDLSPRRDYLYIDDLINALTLTIGNEKYQVFNVGSGVSVSISDIINCVGDVLNIRKNVISKNEVRKDEIPDIVADVRKIKEVMGWEPMIGLKEGIKRTIDIIYSQIQDQARDNRYV